jgi:hypothetical protein
MPVDRSVIADPPQPTYELGEDDDEIELETTTEECFQLLAESAELTVHEECTVSGILSTNETCFVRRRHAESVTNIIFYCPVWLCGTSCIGCSFQQYQVSCIHALARNEGYNQRHWRRSVSL